MTREQAILKLIPEIRRAARQLDIDPATLMIMLTFADSGPEIVSRNLKKLLEEGDD